MIVHFLVLEDSIIATVYNCQCLPVSYRAIKLMKETIMKSTATTPVAMKSVFSGPRLVPKPESTLSEPPKAPIPAERFCRSIPATSITESAICIMGKIVAIILNE